MGSADNETINPFKLRSNARALEQLDRAERVDIVHAQSVGGAWSAKKAAAQIAVWLVTTLPDVPVGSGLRAYRASSLARGDRVITPSNFAATPVIARYDLPRERLTVIPRSIDTDAFDPAAVSPNVSRPCARPGGSRRRPHRAGARTRCAVERADHADRHRARAGGRAASRDSCSCSSASIAAIAQYARSVIKQAQAQGVDALFRFTGHCRDLPAAFAAADIVVVPAIEPPVLGRVVAEAQAMGRPVVTSDIGILPEHVVTPPEMPEDVRTGWLGKPAIQSSSPVRSASRSRSTTRPTARWRHARGNSPNTCSRRTATRWRPGGLHLVAGSDA